MNIIVTINGTLVESANNQEVIRLPRECASFNNDEEYTEYIAQCDTLEAIRFETIKQNIINAGYTENQIEIKWVTDEELASIIASQPKTPNQIMEEARIKIQELLDSTARERLYDNIFTLVSYRDSSDPTLQAEGQAAYVWRDACWVKSREIRDEVLAGTRPLPTVADILLEMPVFAWPD